MADVKRPLIEMKNIDLYFGTFQALKNVSVDFNAAMANTAISFAFRDDPAYISFGDVSLLDLTTGASSNLLANGNFSGGTYQDQKGQLAPMGWSYGNSNGAQFAGMVSSSPYACAGFSSGNCWYDGSMMAYDTLSQGVATNVGDRYQLSFMYSENSHQSLFSSLSNNGLSGRAGNGIDIAAYAKAGVPGGPDVPEPGSLALFAAGLLGLALFLRAQRRRSY